MQFKGKNASFTTNAAGDPVVVFIGKCAIKGAIKGERYARTLVYSKVGNTIKNYWKKRLSKLI